MISCNRGLLLKLDKPFQRKTRIKMLKKIFWISLILLSLIFYGCPLFFETTDISFSDYFPTNPGHYLQYQFSLHSNYPEKGGRRYITFQKPTVNNEPRYMYSSDAWDTSGLESEVEYKRMSILFG